MGFYYSRHKLLIVLYVYLKNKVNLSNSTYNRLSTYNRKLRVSNEFSEQKGLIFFWTILYKNRHCADRLLPVLAALSAWPVFEATTRTPTKLVAVPWTAMIHTGYEKLILSGSPKSS